MTENVTLPSDADRPLSARCYAHFFYLSPRFKLYLHSSGTLHSADWSSVTGVSGLPIGPFFHGGETSRLSRNAGNYKSTLRNIPEERRSFGGVFSKITLLCKGTVHPCTGTEALYRPYGP